MNIYICSKYGKYKIVIKNNLVLENRFDVNVLRMDFTLL